MDLSNSSCGEEIKKENLNKIKFRLEASSSETGYCQSWTILASQEGYGSNFDVQGSLPHYHLEGTVNWTSECPSFVRSIDKTTGT